MTVEDQRGPFVEEGGAMDRFPVGMRVLAVDDNPICLKMLEELLHKCQYRVTATNQAIKALQMLRENRNQFDLVITDVHMPDMDGFKLLELLGLEMDLPVIMLSGFSDTELVLKGISHGACDYLLKPVRIEELKNIWQHVIRRKNFDPKAHIMSSSQERACCETGEAEQVASPDGTSDRNEKINRKRKDQDEDEEEEFEDDEHENEDPSTQKKPRVVWSPELHRKFVAAVNQLGFEKAVPKKILDLMNVEGLTRENVASHLQKFRLYLKRLSVGDSFGVNDPSYMHLGGVDGFGDLRSLTGPRRLSNASLSPYTPAGMLGRLNSRSGLSIRGIASSGLVQPSHSQNMGNCVNNNIPVKLQPALPANQSPNLFQAIPAPLELKQLQQSMYTSHIGESIKASCSSIPSDSVGSSDPLILHGTPQHIQGTGMFGNQSSLRVASLNPDSFDIGISSQYLDDNRCNDSWHVAVQLSKFPSNCLPMSEPFNHGPLHASNGSCPDDFSAVSVLTAPAGELRGNVQNQEGLIGDVVPTIDCGTKQGYNQNLNRSFNATNSMVSANVIVDQLSQSLDQNEAVCSKNMNSSLYDQLNGETPSAKHPNEFEKSAMETIIKPGEDYLWEQTKSPEGFVENSYGSLNDIMSSIMKREQNENVFMGEEFGFDSYSLGSSCI